MNTWKEHHGGIVPEDIQRHDRITMRFRNGKEHVTDYPHGWHDRFYWKDKEPSDLDIIAYKKENNEQIQKG